MLWDLDLESCRSLTKDDLFRWSALLRKVSPWWKAKLSRRPSSSRRHRAPAARASFSMRGESCMVTTMIFVCGARRLIVAAA